ncbi:CD151 antigen [Ceratina calcarata]|uniref:Tetraspanin n=1 Tax=Ceratina calcarata TaxID=156304 RepID=A0AAJ7IZR6_9HYME|nr:CD151 antigen [Ceratina calcarata]XP_017880550.1 CD151 antigen [Ceratina calcarata]
MGYGTEMDGCGRCMKYALFFVNFVIFIGGIAIVGLAAWALLDKVPWIGELVGNDLLTGATYILLAGGIVVAIVSFFGCIGASREVKCMLLTYCIIMFLLFVTMLIGGVLAYVFREKLVGTLEREMTSSMRVYDSRRIVREAWDTTQSTLHCCGVNGWRDWGNQGLSVPESCCREIQPGQRFNCNAGSDTVNPSNAYLVGCINGTQIYMQKHATIMGGAGIAVACLMFFGMIFSCILFKMIE